MPLMNKSREAYAPDVIRNSKFLPLMKKALMGGNEGRTCLFLIILRYYATPPPRFVMPPLTKIRLIKNKQTKIHPLSRHKCTQQFLFLLFTFQNPVTISEINNSVFTCIYNNIENNQKANVITPVLNIPVFIHLISLNHKIFQTKVKKNISLS